MSATAAPHVAALPSRAAVMAKAGRENFPVASIVLGRRLRTHLLAIYGFARLVDDLGDELDGDRGGALDWIDRELDRVYAGQQPEHPVMLRLAATVRSCALPAAPFRRLVQANRQDQVVSRYETFDELLAYCQLSAAPVGELVLHVLDAATPERTALSDRICAALQIVEHLQDIAEDRARGRVYLPREDLVCFGCTDRDLSASSPSSASSAPSASPSLRAVIGFEADRARRLLADGAPLACGLPARGRIAVAGFVAGGEAALDALARARYDVFGLRPRRRRRVFAAALAKAVIGR